MVEFEEIKLSRLSGPNLFNVRSRVAGMLRNYLNNGFLPDGKTTVPDIVKGDGVDITTIEQTCGQGPARAVENFLTGNDQRPHWSARTKVARAKLVDELGRKDASRGPGRYSD